MAINWEDLQDTSDTDPPIVTIYGPAKTGKTTLASEFPTPYYCRTSEGERQSAGVPMKSFGVSDGYADVIDQMDWMLEAEHDRCTFVLDALDGLEVLIMAEACARNGWTDIEEPGFGKGYAAAQSIWHEFMAKVFALKKAGYFVVLISHIKAKTVPGITTESYPKYMLNLRDDAGSYIADNSDLVGFLHQRAVVKKEELGFKKTANRAEGGGDIMIAVEGRPGFVAGNRYSIPKPTLPYKTGEGFNVLAEYFPDPVAALMPANDNGAGEVQEGEVA